MAPDAAPEPPAEIPDQVLDGLDELGTETLRTVADYATTLAAVREAEANDEDDTTDDVEEPPDEYDADEWDEATEDVDVPSKASVTVKTINDNRYYYYQWREGDKIKSEYVAPVSPG